MKARTGSTEQGHAPRRGRLRAAVLAGAAVVLAAAAAGPAPSAAAATSARAAQDSITPAMIALGQRIFRGQVGGSLCMACHGLDARGAPGLGPNLTDDQWLHGDGSLQFLHTIIRTGVPNPKEGGAPMPPYGGAPLTEAQLRAVAAYVYSLSHR